MLTSGEKCMYMYTDRVFEDIWAERLTNVTWYTAHRKYKRRYPASVGWRNRWWWKSDMMARSRWATAMARGVVTMDRLPRRPQRLWRRGTAVGLAAAASKSIDITAVCVAAERATHGTSQCCDLSNVSSVRSPLCSRACNILCRYLAQTDTD